MDTNTDAAQDVSADTTGGSELDRALVDSILHFSFLVQSVLGRIADEEGLSIPQVRLLAVVEDRQIGMLELSQILELGKSSLTGLVDRAERRGLVRRVPVPGDRRAIHIQPSDQGREIIDRVRASVRKEILRLAEPLTPESRRATEASISLLIQQYAAHHSIPL